MINKFLFLSLVLLTSILAISFVSADAASEVSGFMSSIGSVISAILEGLQPVADLLFGKPDQVAVTQGTPSFFLVEILLLIIVFALVYTVLDNFDFFSSNTWVLWVVSVAVSILSVRFMSDGWINAVLFPYQALGIALTAIIPFIIYFIFVEVKLKDQNPFLRKFLWIFFAVVFLFMYISRQWLTESPSPPLFIWIYLVTAGVALLMSFVDGTIQSWVTKGKVEAAHARSRGSLIRHLQRELKQAEDDYRGGILTSADYKREVTRIKGEIAALS